MPKDEVKDEGSKPDQAELPPLSDHDFRTYNRMAEHMDMFHNHFRQNWNLLWNACNSGRRPQGMSLKQFVDVGLRFAEGLGVHHGIEERFVFPMLAERMPEFKSSGGGAELLRQHKQIHAGLDGFEEYLKKCRAGDTEFEMGVLREKMSTFGEVLWTHLDQEVKTLGADNMRRYWSKEDMARMRM